MALRSFILIALVASVSIVSSAGQECGDNEILVICPSNCPSDYCPKCQQGNNQCPKPCPCPPPKCKCDYNYRRAANGTCIPTQDCPPFSCPGPNEQYFPCPPTCVSDACGLARVNSVICREPAVQECNPKCQCNEGFGRLNGLCIPLEECPNFCPKNEEYTPCMQKIKRSLYCGFSNNTMYTTSGWCERGCFCKKSFYKNRQGLCVRANQCEAPLCPNANEEYTISLTPNCPIFDTCFSMIAEIECNEPQLPGCTCKGGFLRLNETSPCIPTCECPELEGAEECE